MFLATYIFEWLLSATLVDGIMRYENDVRYNMKSVYFTHAGDGFVLGFFLTIIYRLASAVFNNGSNNVSRSILCLRWGLFSRVLDQINSPSFSVSLVT